MRKFLQEFKAFAVKGNVIDLAVGVIIGSSFTAIVNSLVQDVLTPLLSLLTKGLDFTTLSLPLGVGEDAAPVTLFSFCSVFIALNHPEKSTRQHFGHLIFFVIASAENFGRLSP